MLLHLLSRLGSSEVHSLVVSLGKGGALKKRFEDLGIPVVSLEMTPRSVPLGATWKLLKAVRRFRPQIIQGWMLHGNLAACIARVVASEQPFVVWSIHQTLYDLSREKPTTAKLVRIAARLSSQPRAIVYCSRVSRSQHEALGFSGRNAVLIPNGFDTDAFAPSDTAGRDFRRELGIPDDALLIGMIGRFHPMKDHQSFVRAAAQVSKRHPRSRFLMAGPGVSPDNETLTASLRNSGISSSVHLLGSREDMPRIYPALDVMVSSSSFGEAFPLVVGEAMSCGVPCVVTDVGDSAELVGDTGIVVPPRDPERLAAEISRMLDLPAEERRSLGASARTRVQAEFALERSVASFADLYRSLCEAAQCRRSSEEFDRAGSEK